MNARPRPLALATVLLFLLGLVGLATVDEEGSTRLTAAAAATTAQATARMAMSASFVLGTAETKMAGEGVLDMANERARLTMTSPFLPAPMNLVVDGPTAYVDSALPQFQVISQGKPWVALDVSSSTAGVPGDPLGGAGNPLRSLRLLGEKGVARGVRQVGVEDVRGTPTTRYTGELDVSKLLRAADSQQAQALDQTARGARGEVEVWLDDADVVRRAVLRISFDIAGQPVSNTLTLELFDFGVPVDIALPPADQVQRLS